MSQYGQPEHYVLHLSDTHLLAGDAPQYGVDTVARFPPAARAAGPRDPAPGARVSPATWPTAASPGLRPAARARRAAAARIGAQVVWCMGNHDERAALRTRAVRRGADADARTGSTTSPGCGSSPRHPPCRAGTTASHRRAARLAADVLATPAEHGTILALHHPPIPCRSPAREVVELRDRPAGRVLRGTDVRAILGGHYHFTSTRTFAGIPVSVAAATCYTQDLKFR